jgi:C4-dicarboxylate-specific signal transduction histidine kinase
MIAPLARTAYRALLMSGSDEPQISEYHVRSSEGEDRFITWRGVALRDPDNVPTGIMLSGEDITDQRRAESEAHKALERLNSVRASPRWAKMAAGISHELNQPLAGDRQLCQACRRLLRQPGGGYSGSDRRTLNRSRPGAARG